MRIVTATAFAAALALSGCIDIEMDVTALGPDQARVNGSMTVARAMLDMMGGPEDFCDAEDGGTLVMTDTHARCDLLVEGSITEVFPPEDDSAPQMTDLGDGSARVVFLLGDMTADTVEMRDDPEMAQMFLPMLQGHSVTLRIRGSQIVSTNGTLSDDGTSASFSFQLDHLLDKDFAMPDTFEAVVRY